MTEPVIAVYDPLFAMSADLTLMDALCTPEREAMAVKASGNALRGSLWESMHPESVVEKRYNKEAVHTGAGQVFAAFEKA